MHRLPIFYIDYVYIGSCNIGYSNSAQAVLHRLLLRRLPIFYIGSVYIGCFHIGYSNPSQAALHRLHLHRLIKLMTQMIFDIDTYYISIKLLSSHYLKGKVTVSKILS